jgi:hypothetical protein
MNRNFKGLNSIALMLGALLIISTSIASAAIKPGSNCAKIGATSIYAGKKYTCIKSGKKLVWNKGVAVVAPKPAAAPTATSIQTTGKFIPPSIPGTFQELEANLSGIIYGAWVKASDQLRSSQVNLGNVQVYSGPNTIPGNPDPLIPLRLTSQLYSKFESAKNVYIIEIANGDKDWAQNIFDQYVDVTYGNVKTAVASICENPDCNMGQAHHLKNWDGILLIGKAPNYLGTGKSRPQVLNGMEYAHEYIHVIQSFNAKDRAYFAPTWLREGQANYAATAITMRTSYTDYVNERYVFLQQQYKDSATFNAEWVEKFINPYLTISENADPYSYYNQYPRWYPYAIGCMVNEIFTAIKGPDAAMNIFKRLGQGQTFPSAFQSEFGTTWAEAVPYISRAISSQLSLKIKS